MADHPALGAVYGDDGTRPFALPHLGKSALTGAGAVAMQFAIKTANGPATTTTLGELRLRHQRRPRAQMA